MQRPKQHIKVLQRRLEFLKKRLGNHTHGENAAWFMLSEVHALEWAIQILLLLDAAGRFKTE